MTEFRAVVCWAGQGGASCQSFASESEAESFAATVGGLVVFLADGAWEVRADLFGSGEFVPVCGGVA